ncbi:MULTISPECIES: TonB-dependent receptor [unclassified Sphingomonas]|uniref:TonB-dependent receptor n=1 Tax=unclassified Sphingomonas TaxID=196159 RepID=UPI0006F20037|nr:MULTISPECIES: TonB-dependent receptor [unclassified Sphingomonas]KQM63599.1 TonB-dependent receptor [Sphingomonas sp. Leaf16]KQN15215.1 TonB-dependent receptor [Sphingomonas sp. Leaf29]KQN20759.1 TonB-dependent receptor [Sphingomonas sp. Leaf32]
MRYGSSSIVRSMLLGAVSVLGLAAPALAQTDPAGPPATADQTEAPADDIVVTGIRASQARSVEIKRNADSVVEAISAQDIGKLPDVTISDSLQRIPGVQIRREAGEGGAVNIRGLPQVTTLMNGEQFLGANSVTTVQPNFTDIPSQLFSGATVFKSPTASLQQAGLSGTVDLLTRRPMDLKRGLTLSAAAEGQYGDKTEKWSPSANGLVAYHGERFGVLVSAAYSDLTLGNSFRGLQDYGVALNTEAGSATNQGAFATGNNGVSRGRAVRNGAGTIIGYDVNGDGDANDAFITPQSHTAWNRITNRERFGANASLQFEINDALKLTADGFYTRQTQYDRTAGFQFQNVDWLSSPFLPTKSRDTGAVVNGYNVNTVQQYTYSLPSFDSYSETFRTKSESQNYNVQLDWQPSDQFKGTIRGIYGKASRKRDQAYTQFSLTNGTQWAYNGVGNYPASVGGDRQFNPTGYQIYSQTATVDYSSGAPVFGFSPAFLAQASDPSRYGLKTISSEGNQYQNGDLWAVRADGEYTAENGVKLSFGGRYGERSVDQFTFDRVSPFYAGNRDNAANPAGGCLVKWKAFDVNLNDNKCAVRDAQGNAYTAGYTRQANDPVFAGLIKQYALPAGGTPALYALDPHAMDDSEAWQNKFYPGSQNLVNPADSFTVNVRQISGYGQVSGEGELFGMPFRANGGLQVVNTRLNVRQNIVGAPQPYGVSGVDAGDVVTKREFTDFLPAFNVAFDVTDKLRARAAFSKTMTVLDFLQWGGGLNVNYAINTQVNPARFEARTADSRGNPNLNPWRATNAEASLEYYTGRSSLVAVGAFYISVDSFITTTTETRNDIPDNDGVIRRPVITNTLAQGEGGTLKGIEASARQSLADYGVNGLLGGFGVDANYTLSLGDAGQVDLAGNKMPFQDNSKHQVNAALWFEKYGLQARVAYNFRSKRLASSNYGGIQGLAQYQEPTSYLDASISYDVTPQFSIYGQASNLTGETERYYLTWQDQVFNENIYERRFIAGVRAKF